KELHMGILEELLAGGQRQKEYSDFVNRYEQGHPSQGYSDQEVLKRYGEVSHAVPSDQYAQAAQEALSKLSPEERAVFVKMLQDRAAARGLTLPGKVAPEPKELGQVLTDLHKKPGQLRDMLGADAIQPQQQASASSPITDILSSPMAKAVLAGIAAILVKRAVGRSRGSNASGKTRARPHRRAFLPLIDAADDFAVADADELIEQDGPLLQRVFTAPGAALLGQHARCVVSFR